MHPDVLIVVARHREETAWLEELGLPAVVYDKSGRPGPHALPNIGRETHTYLRHIVVNYPRFSAYTAFIQAAPFGHMGPGAGPGTLRAAIERAMRLGVGFSGFAWFKLKCDRLGRPHDMADSAKQGRWAGWGKDIPVGEVYAKLFAGPVPETFVVPAPAGLFLVSRERILARPVEFFQVALEIIEADPEDANNTGHAFERLWQVVFNGNPALNRAEHRKGAKA